MTLPPDPVSAPPSAPITVVPPLRPAVPPVRPPAGYLSPAAWAPPSGPPPGRPLRRPPAGPGSVLPPGPLPRQSPLLGAPRVAPPGVRMAPPPGWRPVTPPPAYRVLPRPQPPALAPDGKPLASFADRLGAYLLDRLVISALLMLPALVLGCALLLPPILDDVRARNRDITVGGPESEPSPARLFGRYLLLIALLLVLQCVVSYGYEVIYQTRTGQTVGKRALRIRAQALDGGALTRQAATVRWLVTLGGLVVPGFSYVDGLWQLWDRPLQQCLHDKAAQTVVVKL